MFEHLKKHRVILVVGPHRSGTTICARMIARDTGHDFVIEDEINFSNAMMMEMFVQANYAPLVIQCPFVLPFIEMVPKRIGIDKEDICVVMMHRYVKDIIASEEKAKRVNFKGIEQQQKIILNAIDDPRHVSDIKYERWEEQRKAFSHTFDVGYESLSDHPLWVQDRSTFRFEHEIKRKRKPIPRGFLDGLRAIQT